MIEISFTTENKNAIGEVLSSLSTAFATGNLAPGQWYATNLWSGHVPGRVPVGRLVIVPDSEFEA